MLRYTLPETNSSPLKIGHPNRKVVFQPSIFRGENVSFRECMWMLGSFQIGNLDPRVTAHGEKNPQVGQVGYFSIGILLKPTFSACLQICRLLNY